MTKLASNPSLPTSRSKGKPNGALHSLPSDSNPFLEDPIRQAANAFAYLSGLKPPNMSHRSPHLSEKTDALWLVTLREVAFHFSKIGEAIHQCASETEKLIQSHEGGGSGMQGAKGSQTLNHNLLRANTNGPQHSIGEYPNGTRPHQSQTDHFGYSVVVNDSGNSSSKTTPRCFRHPPVYPNSYAGGRQMHKANGLKRRPPLSVSELDHRSRQPQQVVPLERGEHLRSYVHPKFPRPHKRIRINWTDEENSLFFDTIRKNSDKDEQTVLREIVSALGGSRSWIQCKGHFRNLFAVGRITREKDASKTWMVHEEENEKEQDEAKEPAATSRTKNEGKESESSSPLNSSTGTSNGKVKACNPSISNSHLHKNNVLVDNRCVERANREARKSASIDRIMNPTSQDEKERDAPNMRKTQMNGEQRQLEYHMIHKKDAGTTKKAYMGPQTTRDGERHGFDVSRDRETAIFMIRQAAAKEAYERSKCEPAGENDLRTV